MISLKKELKRARLFEVQKLTKRIRAVEKRRGTAKQLEKNRRKVVRLQCELDKIKDVDIGGLCSRIQLREDHTIHLAVQQQPPANSEEKGEWRILTSKTATRYLKDITKPEKQPISQDDRVPECGDHRSSPETSGLSSLEHPRPEERGREGAMLDEHSFEHPTQPGAGSKSGEKGLGSVFVTSLSAISGGSDKKRFHRKRKVFVHRNRLGQRARRKLWEQKYGRSAKHLSKPTTKRRYTARTHGGADEEVHSSSKVTVSRTLHPSWSAKKQQQTAIQQFQGHKIVFDSD